MEVQNGISVIQLMKELKVEMPQYVTVAVNHAFLEKERYDGYSPKEGGTVVFIYFMGGGCDGAEQ